jgi:low temperature requirement protein LtrA
MRADDAGGCQGSSVEEALRIQRSLFLFYLLIFAIAVTQLTHSLLTVPRSHCFSRLSFRPLSFVSVWAVPTMR